MSSRERGWYKLLNIVDSIFKYTVIVLFGALSLLLFFSCLFLVTYYNDYSEIPSYGKNNVIMLILFFILSVLGLILVNKYFNLSKLNTNKLICVLITYVFILSIFWIYMSRTVPLSDQLHVSEAAEHFSIGNFQDLLTGGYLFVYPFQLGFVGLLEIVYRVIGENGYIFYKFLNVVFLCVAFFAIYKISGELFSNKRINNIVLLLLFGCFVPMFYCSYIYPEIIYLTLFLVAIWMELAYFNHNKIIYFIISLISISLSVLLKGNGMIVWIAMIIMMFLSVFKSKKFVNLVLVAALILGGIIPMNIVHSIYQNRSGIEINEGAPKILWVAMGFQESNLAPGWWNGYSYSPYIENNYNKEKTKEEAKKDLINSMSNFKENPDYARSFFSKKFLSQWNDPSYQAYIMNHSYRHRLSRITNSLYYGKLHKISIDAMNIYHFLIVAFSLSFIMLRWKKINTYQLIIAIMVLGGFIFHMVWEAKGRYIMPYFIAMIPYAAAGAEAVLQLIEDKVLKGFLAKIE